MAEIACEVWFYHLERTGLDQALPELLEKTLQRGWKAIVRTPTSERIDHLDGWLWRYRDDSFLPHAPATEPDAARQPILLTSGTENLNGADALFLIDGADEDQLRTARGQWTAVKARGLPMSYWKQQARGWEKQA